MSIQVLRDGLLTKRRSDRDASLHRRSSRLRALNAVTQALTSRVGLPHALHSDFDTTPPTQDESVFLDQHDIQKYDSSSSPPSKTGRNQRARRGRRCSTSDFATRSDAVKHAITRSWSTKLSKPAASLDSDSSAPLSETNVVDIPPPTENEDSAPVTVSKPQPSLEVRIESSGKQDDTPSPQSDSPVTAEPTPKVTEHSPATSLSEHPIAQPDSPVSVKLGASAHDLSAGDGKDSEINDDTTKDADGDIDLPDTAAGADTVRTSTTSAGPSQKQAKETTPTEAIAHPQIKHSSPATPVPTVERMQTRVSSGAMRQKSVAEIMQETPKSGMRRKAPGALRDSSSAALQPAKATPSRPRRESVAALTRNKSAVRLTPTKSEPALPFDLDAFSSLIGAADDPNRDYLEPLYRIQAQDPPNGRSLVELVHKANKAVSTTDQLTCYKERQDHRILKRIYGLQYANHWSLRQMQPCPEPPAPKTHWDHVIAEAKWMRTDFRQERKEKRMLAKFLAERCAEWVAADAAARLQLQVKVRSTDMLHPVDATHAPQSPAATHIGPNESKDDSEEPMPELDSPSKDDHSSPEADMDPATPQFAIVPDTMFTALNVSEDTACLLESEDFVRMVNDLPLYAPFDLDEDAAPRSSMKLISQSTPAVSKFSNDKIMIKAPAYQRKRSRFDYEEDEPELPDAKRPRASLNESGLAPEQIDIALFDMEHKAIKDRLRAGTNFRPPSEYNMPSEKFYEWRLSSQWTWEDDQKLRKLAKDFSFNWSLVANQMALPSHFHGAADRRTPWECFERWIELETLPGDVKKTNYFRTWYARLEAASRQVEARHQAQLQAHAQNSNATQPPMKRRTMPARVERRRTGRYLHVIDAMRKLARKREQQQHKQAEAQKAASLRKQHEPTQPTKATVHTPAEFSKLRHERDVQMAARNERMREHMMQQQKVAQLQRAGQTPAQQQAILAAQQQRQGSQQATNGQMQGGQAGQNGGQLHHNGVPVQNRNGQASIAQMGMQSNVPQAQMQANMRTNNSAGGQMTQEQIQRMALQAQMKGGVPNAAQMKHYQQQMMNNANHGVLNGQLNQSQAAMLAAMQANQNNLANSQHQNGNANGNGMSASPNMPPPQPKQLSSGHIPAIAQIKHSLQAAHPQATPQQIDQMANEQMKRHIQSTQARQNAVNAASGNYGGVNQFQQQAANGAQGNGFNNANGASQQQYSQLMRQRLLQQQQQQQQGGQQQSQQGQNLAASASPRPQQASPANMHSSPALQQATPQMANGVARPPSRNTATPMARIPSSGSMPSPGLAQGSPRPQMVKQG